MTSLPASASCSSPLSFSLSSLLSLLCLALLSLSACSAQSDVGSVVIYSASGCTDVGNVTVNCSFPTLITLQTSGLGSLQYLYIVVSSSQAQVSSSLASVVNDSVTFILAPQGYTPSLVGPMLSIQLYNLLTRNTSQPLLGLSLAPIPPPVLQSISGCSGSGSATLGCQPNVTTLTLTGQGLTWLSAGYYSLWIGTASTSVSGGGPNDSSSVNVLSDSVALLSLGGLYTYLLLPVHYGGSPLPLYLTLPVWNYCQQTSADTPSPSLHCVERAADALWLSRCCCVGKPSSALPYRVNSSVSVSFPPMPPPSVTTILAQGCNGTGLWSSTPPFTQCIPFASQLLLYGSYLYDAQVTVGGAQCIANSNAMSITCWMPVIPDYVPGQYYDVQLVNTAGAVSLAGLISFVGGPVLTYMTQCVNYGIGAPRQLGGGCQPGTPVLIYGVGFYPDDSLQILFTRFGPTANFSCLQPSFINSTTLSCTLPTAASSSSNVSMFLGRAVSLQVSFGSAGVLTNSISVTALDWPNPPLVSTVSGSCSASNSALAVIGCAMGTVLTMSGSNLNGTSVSVYSSGPIVQNGVSLGFTYFQCVLQSVSPSAISCLLPTPGDEIMGSITPGVSYKFFSTMMDSNGRSRRANTFSVAFAPAASALTSSTGGGGGGDGGGGGGSSTSVILIGVLVPVLVLLLVLVSVLLWRRWVLTKRANSGSGAAAPSAGDRFEHFTDVEMR